VQCHKRAANQETGSPEKSEFRKSVGNGKGVWLRNGLGRVSPISTKIKKESRAKKHTTYRKTERKEAVEERKRREDHKWGVERVGGQANELRLSLRMRLDGLVLTWLGRVTSGGAVLSSSYIVGYYLRIISI
jgi:hypothetical protein